MEQIKELLVILDDPSFLELAVGFAIMCIVILTTVELLRYIEDAYYFRTLNWSTQFECRQSIRLLRSSMLFHMDTCGLDSKYHNKKKRQCVNVMRLAEVVVFDTAIDRRIAFKELTNYVNKNGLYGLLMSIEDPTKIYSKYGIWGSKI